MINADLTAIAFGAFNLLRLASYLPQIAAVARDRHGATAISFSCWSIWIGANGSTALYAWINLSDLNLAVISAFNAACCATVLLLAVYKRLRVQAVLVSLRSGHSIRSYSHLIGASDMSDHEPWQLDGEAPELYERYLVPTITSIWAADLVERARPAADERVLDIACGTGAVTRLVADRISTGRVVGLDYNPGMLAVARSVCPQGPSLEWLEGSALSLPFHEGSFDLVLCQLGLQFFADRRLALREMRRVLAPKGRVALSVLWSHRTHASRLRFCEGPRSVSRAECVEDQARRTHVCRSAGARLPPDRCRLRSC